MSCDELTIADVLKDPLIRLMMLADNVSLKEMKILLDAARVQKAEPVGNRRIAQDTSESGRLISSGRSRYTAVQANI